MVKSLYTNMLNRISFLATRRFSVAVNRDNTSQKFEHPFRQFLDKTNAVRHLLQNIIYQDDDILVLNKPAGLGKSPPPGASGESSGVSHVYMENLMKDVAAVVPKFENLTIVKFPERYSSGILIIAKSDRASAKINKCKLRAKCSDESFDCYLAVSQGRPAVRKNSCRVAIRLAENEGNKRKVPILEESWTQGERKKQRVKLIRVSHSVVCEGPLASLTRVGVSSAASNILRLYFATKLLSPILGDNIFSGRVKDLLGVPMLLDPWSDVANSAKRLPPELLRSLRLSSNESSLVPLCVHLERVVLPRYRKGEDLVFHAPIPETFRWVCQQLSLDNLPETETLSLGSGHT